MERQTIYVFSDWQAGTPPQLMGKLYIQPVRGKEVFAFEFELDWLKSQDLRLLDPDLQFSLGAQYTAPGQSNFGLFLDSAPDRWGRQLIRRREVIRARQQGRPAVPLQESDYLLGVYDETRMGAIRFRLSLDGEFVSSDRAMAAPSWASLRELEAASRNFEDESQSDIEHEKWLSMLIAPGSSLGGARPKANVLDSEDNLWIAKFPSRADSFDISAWEMVTYQLAKQVGLNLPECRLERFSKTGATFLSRRFDRRGKQRLHFASAMTLLGQKDGTDYQSGITYLELAEFIRRYSAQPKADLWELWRRIVFNIAVKNTDDHLRNHGFLLSPQGWRLSPAYDLNPNPDGVGLSLNISENDNSLDFELALEVSPLFEVSADLAAAFIQQTKTAIKEWRKIAERYGLGRFELMEMAPAFESGI